MEMSFIIPAEDNERFAKDAFEGTVGRSIIVNGQKGVVNSWVVAEDGKSVEFIVLVEPIIWGDYKGDPADY